MTTRDLTYNTIYKLTDDGSDNPPRVYFNTPFKEPPKDKVSVIVTMTGSDLPLSLLGTFKDRTGTEYGGSSFLFDSLPVGVTPDEFVSITFLQSSDSGCKTGQYIDSSGRCVNTPSCTKQQVIRLVNDVFSCVDPSITKKECDDKYPCFNPTDDLLDWINSLDDRELTILKESFAPNSCFDFKTLLLLLFVYVILMKIYNRDATMITVGFIGLIITYILTSITLCNND
jgi:hypothetical protein